MVYSVQRFLGMEGFRVPSMDLRKTFVNGQLLRFGRV